MCAQIHWRPRVATIVLNFRNLEDIVRCVRSLLRSTVLDQQIIVVDNAADGPEHQRLADAVGPTVTTLATGDNLGYAAGINLGIAYARGWAPEFFWLLNPDSLVEPATLAGLLAGAEDVPDAGIIGCRVLYDGEPAKIWFDGGTVDRSDACAQSHVNKGVFASVAGPSLTREVDYVTGACMLLRRRMIEHVGRAAVIPEDYFRYFEDTHLCLLAQAAGWRTIVAGQTQVRQLKRSRGLLEVAVDDARSGVTGRRREIEEVSRPNVAGEVR